MPMPFNYDSAYGNLQPGMLGSSSPNSGMLRYSSPNYGGNSSFNNSSDMMQKLKNLMGSMSGGSGSSVGMGNGMGGGMNPASSSMMNSIFDLFNSPDSAAMDAYKKYFNQATGAQNPFYNAGVGALGDYQKWLGGMSDPSKFINKTMEGYQESPWSKYLQNASVKSGQNAASASGLMGSTPFAHELEQHAKDISSSDMGSWLQNVLGINTQYGGGLNNLVQGGQHSADVLSQLFGGASGDMAGLSYNKAGQKNKDWSNILNTFMSGGGGGSGSGDWASMISKILPFL